MPLLGPKKCAVSRLKRQFHRWHLFHAYTPSSLRYSGYALHACRSLSVNPRLLFFFFIRDHQTCTTPTEAFDLEMMLSRGWCTNCQNLREQQNMYTTPRIAIAMFTMVFVGVVRGLWGSIFSPEPTNGERTVLGASGEIPHTKKKNPSFRK